MTLRRVALACAASVALVSGCSGRPAAVTVAPPTASASAGACTALAAALPDKLNGLSRRTTTPASVRVAAWGSPAVVLRCGVTPVATDAGDHVTADGVGWLTPGQTGDLVVWTTTGFSPSLELRVPASINDQENLLSDLAAAVTGALSRVPAPASAAASAQSSAPPSG